MTKPSVIIGSERTSITMNKEADQFLDVLIANPEITKRGIYNRHQLATACLGIYVERLNQLASNKENRMAITPIDKVDQEKFKVSVAVPLRLSEVADQSVDYPIIRSMWLPHKTQILNAMFRSLLLKYNPQYRDVYDGLFRVTLNDLARVVSV